MTDTLSSLETSFNRLKPDLGHPPQPSGGTLDQTEIRATPLTSPPLTGEIQPVLASEMKPISAAGTRSGWALGRICIVLLVVLILVNIPLNRHGRGLAHFRAETTTVSIQEGSLLQADESEIYVVENYRLRQFSSFEVFARFRSRYHLQAPIQTVTDDTLAHFGQGRPIRWLVQCQNSPEVYAVAAGQKHLVQYSPADNSRWDELHLVTCHYLANLPDGPALSDPDQDRN